MNTATSPEKAAAPDPKAWGSLTKMLSRVIGHMPADDRTALMQDAAAFSQNEIGKAREILAAETGHEKIGIIDDQWDGAPDATPKITHSHGPGSTAAPGSINVAPSQAASGNNAERMEPQYSRHSPQTGVQAATEKLGRDVMSIAKAMTAVMQALEGHGAQLEVLKSSTVIQTPEALQTLVSDAVTKAVTQAMTPLKSELLKAVAKADKKKSDDDENDDDEAKHGEFGKANDVLIKAENDEEEDDDQEKSAAIEAAGLRLMAKSRVAFAKMRISKALDLAAEDKTKGASRAYGLAQINIAKAQSYIDQAVALRDGRIGPSTETIIKGITKAKSGVPAAEMKMQDKWPNSDAKQVGKAAEPAAAVETAKTEVPPANAADLAKAMEQIQKAAEGMGMLQATVGDLMGALARSHSGEATATAASDRLPPVFALAKANSSDYASREAELARLRDASVISFDDYDRARDAITRARMNLPEDTIKAMIDKLPVEARDILNRNAA